VNEWIAERRMAEARRLLLETDLTVEAIAGRCGFADTGYFRRQFRRHHEMAPVQWRAAAVA
jgi:AraC-like DNA-binding protein